MGELSRMRGDVQAVLDTVELRWMEASETLESAN
jgi:ATP-binding cassette, subfamily F, member 3